MLHMVNTTTASAVLALALALSAISVRAQSAAISSVAPPSAIYGLEPLGRPQEIKQVEPLVDWLPIWGKEAREKGFDLPLPFGIGLTYTYIKQNMVVSNVTIEGKPLGVVFRDAGTITNTGVIRGDARGCFRSSMSMCWSGRRRASRGQRWFSQRRSSAIRRALQPVELRRRAPPSRLVTKPISRPSIRTGRPAPLFPQQADRSAMSPFNQSPSHRVSAHYSARVSSGQARCMSAPCTFSPPRRSTA